MRLRDLVLAQVLTVVGSSWVGIAAGVGSAQFLVWVLAFTGFYTPMAVPPGMFVAKTPARPCW